MKIDKRKNLFTEFAYIAGFIDGEGCIRIKKANHSGNCYYLIVHITNTELKPLYKIQKIFGGKIQFQEKGKNKDVYQLHLSSNDAANILKTLLGYFIVKAPQARLGIKFHIENAYLTKAQKDRMYWKMRNLKK